MMKPRGHHAIVVDSPEYAPFGNFVPTVLPGRDETCLCLDPSRALHPLHS
jgi:hypothetical protein